jgi:predicted aspartyl protease
MRLAAVVLLGCGAPAPVGPQTPLPDTTCANNVTRATGNQLVVAGVWRGAPVSVVIDTGATISGIAKPLAARHELAVVATTTISGISGDQVAADIHDIGLLRVGGVELVGTQFAAQTHPHGHDFVLGLPQLLGHALVLDIEHLSLCFEPSPHPLATTPLRIAGDAARGQSVVVDATIGELALANMVLDTGAGVSALREDHVAKVSHNVERQQDVLDATGGRITRPLLRIPELCIAGTCLQEQVMIAAPDWSAAAGYPLDGVLGVPVFERHRLVIDFPARTFALVPHPRRD